VPALLQDATLVPVLLVVLLLLQLPVPALLQDATLVVVLLLLLPVRTLLTLLL
jgi:hypothetical protein